MKKFFIAALICLNSLTLSSQYTYSTENLGCSAWAEKEITEAMNENIIPEHLQNNYKSYITRREFCELAVQTIMAKSGRSIEQYEKDNNIVTDKNTFDDTDSEEVLLAHKLGIVSGTGSGKFSPNDYITRQQAAVMLDNIVKFFELKTERYIYEKFIDEEYFASWAKDEIYDITRTRSGDTYIMMGTEKGKFSPWMNYTREQAVSTMLRLYRIFEDNMNLYTENTKIYLEQFYDDGYIEAYLGEGFYLMGNGVIVNFEGKELYEPGEYSYPYGYNEPVNAPRGFDYNWWCRAYRDKFVVKNKNGEMVIIDGEGKILTKPCKEGYTLYNEKYAFEGMVHSPTDTYGKTTQYYIEMIKKQAEKHVKSMEEADKIIDLETGEYIIDNNNNLKEEIMNDRIPLNQYKKESEYNSEYSVTGINGPEYSEYRKNIPDDWEIDSAFAVPRGNGRIVSILESKIPFDDGETISCASALYDGNNFIVSLQRAIIMPLLRGKLFSINNFENVYLVNSYGKIIAKNLKSFNPYYKYGLIGADGVLYKIVFEY